jgi:hypothetical protein
VDRRGGDPLTHLGSWGGSLLLTAPRGALTLTCTGATELAELERDDCIERHLTEPRREWTSLLLALELCEIRALGSQGLAETEAEREAVRELCQQGLRRLPVPQSKPSVFHRDVSSQLRVRHASPTNPRPR